MKRAVHVHHLRAERHPHLMRAGDLLRQAGRVRAE
jgi:hypothetical protein